MNAIDLARLSGQLATALLIATLFAGLHSRTKSQRRTLGLLTFGAATLHALYATTSPLVEDLSHLIYEPHLRAGTTALTVLTVLAATSFPARLKVREWNALHRLVYAAALLAVLHVLLSSHASALSLLLPAAAIVVALAFRASNWRKRVQTRAESTLRR